MSSRLQLDVCYLSLGRRHLVNAYVVERFIKGKNTGNLCAIDLSKAFDKVNHALLMKLIKRNLPVVLIDILENWLKIVFQW